MYQLSWNLVMDPYRQARRYKVTWNPPNGKTSSLMFFGIDHFEATIEAFGKFVHQLQLSINTFT